MSADYAESSVRLYPLCRDISAALRAKKWIRVLALCSSLMYCLGEIAKHAAENMANEVIDSSLKAAMLETDDDK